MADGSLKALYLDELRDLYDAEMQRILTLPRLAEAAHTPELRAALTQQSLEARLQLQRLELIFTHWGEALPSRPSIGRASIVQEADKRLHDATTDLARDAAVVSAAHRIAHYEIGGYGVARLYARWLNRPDDVRLLEETLEEEARADGKLRGIAEARISADLPAA